MNTRLLATLISGLLVTLAAATAVAQECESDSDCDEGYSCALPGFACAEGPNGEGHDECLEEMENLTGECVRGPVECESDADCPGILTCESWGAQSDAPCAVDEEGNVDCPEPEPIEEEFYCDWRPADCDDDTPCAEGFECVASSGPTVGNDCAEACDSEGNCTSDCPDGDEDPDGGFREEDGSRGYCYPTEIECDNDAQCPSDWSCYTLEYSECSGGGSTGSGTVDPDDGDDDGGEGGQEADPVDEECQTFEESRCIPPGFDQLIEQGFGGGGVAESSNGGGLFDNPRGDSNDDGQNTGGNGEEEGNGGGGSTDSGCSVPAGAPNAAPVLLVVLAGLLALRR